MIGVTLAAAIAAHVSSGTVHDVRPEPPEFDRVYTEDLDRRATVQIDVRTFIGDTFKTATLIQPGGRTVDFDPDRVADKILNPTLVPLVRRSVARILKADREWRAARPRSFTDSSGTTWWRDAPPPARRPVSRSHGIRDQSFVISGSISSENMITLCTPAGVCTATIVPVCIVERGC